VETEIKIWLFIHKYCCKVFHRYIRQIEAGGQVLYIPPRDLPAFAQTNDMLLNAEDRVR